MPRIALLGDSVFDNRAYVGTDPDVVGHLRRLASDWEFDLHAVDGNLVRHVTDQLTGVRSDVEFLVVSAGGNNAIDNADILQIPASNSAETLSTLADRAAAFELEYLDMLGALSRKSLPFAVSTIYYPNFDEDAVQKIACAALSVFNDVIISAAAHESLPILDLRRICNEKADYANEIEPSGTGGEKIATAIIKMVERRKSGESGCVIYT